MNGWRLGGWRLAVRLAWRDALRAKGRSLLILAMIALPVTGVVAADVLIRTSQVSAAEGVDRYLGTTAAARVGMVSGDVSQIQVNPFGQPAPYVGGPGRPKTLADVKTILGTDRTYAPFVSGGTLVRTSIGQAYAHAFSFDPASPLSRGLMRLTAGRWPAAPGEVVVNSALAAHGPGLGDRIAMRGEGSGRRTATVVGIAEGPVDRTSYDIGGPPGTIPMAGHDAGSTGWLVGGGDVTFAQVVQLDRIGALTLSRYVVDHPQQLEALYPTPTRLTPTLIAIASMIAVMALLEVVLLAGPAFAVGAKRQARSLALIAASGGTPRQSRRTILAGALVLGGVGAAVGLVAGLGLARLGEPLLQQRASTWLGPFDVRWREVLAVGAFGLVSAILAAIVPAWLASRQDVVAVLAGRRGDRRPSYRTPVAGIVVLALGVLVAVGGTRVRTSTGAVMISASALICVLGMILIVPVVVAGLARLGTHLPLPLRFAVRDGARHRTRTVPAVAAVAAVVAGAVTLGIAVASDQAHGGAEYGLSMPIGQGAVDIASAKPDWSRMRATVEAHLPGATVTQVIGAVDRRHPQVGLVASMRAHGRPLDGALGTGYGPSGTGVLVSDGADLPDEPGLTPAELAMARATLAAGGAFAFTPDPVSDVSLRIAPPTSGAHPSASMAVPARDLAVGWTAITPQAIVSPQVVRRLGLASVPVQLRISGASIDSGQEQRLREALDALPGQPSLYVERGYQPDQTVRLIELVLTALAALLMLGGALTTTFLALSDARPDLATLAAVGAAPRTRRWVAAAYSLSIGLVGSLLGVVVGMVPGIALTYPLTGSGWQPPGSHLASHYLAMPWGLMALVVLGLPLSVAAFVALCTRGHLPIVARLT